MEYKPIFFDSSITRKEKLLKQHLNEHAETDRPPIFALIEFNLCGLCNRNCVFCPRSKPNLFPNLDEHMTIELFEKVMDDLAKIGFDGTILFSAFSEPLLYKHIDVIIGISKEYCPSARIEIITNGDFITRRKLTKLFGSGLTMLCISMYDGPHRLKYFKKLKKELALGDNQLIFRPRWLPPEEHFGITLSNRAGAIEIEEIGLSVLREPMSRACYYPFYQILVDYDGSVLLCTHDWSRRLIAGNVKDDSIVDVWNNDVFKRVRLSLSKDSRRFAPCDLCNTEGILIGREHFDKWVKYYKSNY